MASNHKQGFSIYRHVCPRNCYDTCGVLSYVQDGIVKKVGGDPDNTYTHGQLCAKGYAFTQYLYSADRLRYPLLQSPRGSGNWTRIGWDEAFDIIINKIIGLNRRYGSNLALGFNKFSGNMGFLNQAVEGMFNCLGAHTKPYGNTCSAAGQDSFIYTYGEIQCPDPETMAEANLIILWGVNPAVTAIHQYRFINQARDKGAKIVVIDPRFTPTAAKADIYFQIKPGTDGMLALAVTKLLLTDKKLDLSYIRQNVHGWNAFENYLNEYITMAKAVSLTGLEEKAIRLMADIIAKNHPCAFWTGLGLQRHQNGGQNLRAIQALADVTQNAMGSSVNMFFANSIEDMFPRNLLHLNSEEKDKFRPINLNNFAAEALNFKDPPLKFLWIAGRNPLAQDFGISFWKQLVNELEFIVTVDQYMTETALKSDLVLPTTTFFESYDLNVSLWHYWIGINQKAIDNWYESKSDLQIARELSQRLNQRIPGFSKFPSDLSELDWIEREFTPEILHAFGLGDWRDLFNRPYKLKEQVCLNNEPTPGRKFKLFSLEAKKDSLPALPRFLSFPLKNDAGLQIAYPLQLITAQNLLQIHSQYKTLSWLTTISSADTLQMNPLDAQIRGIKHCEMVLAYNQNGSITTRLAINDTLPQGVVVGVQGPQFNTLIPYIPADMGRKFSRYQGQSYYDTYIEVQRAEETPS